MRVADLELTWTPSPTPGVVSQSIEVVIGAGTATVADLPMDQSVYSITVPANTDFSFSVSTKGDDGRSVKSLVLSKTVGPLADLMPATNLDFRIVNVRDVPDQPTP